MLEQGKTRAEDYVNGMYITEQGIKYHRIQEDDGSRGLSFTCLLVCDPNFSPVYTGAGVHKAAFLLTPDQMASSPM